MASPVICIGAALVDELYFCIDDTVAATSNPAILKRFAGGVAGNIARQLAMLDIPVQLVTVLGNDPDGTWLKDECNQNGIGTDVLMKVDDSTGKYASILNPDGSLYVAACTDPCGKYLGPDFLQEQEHFFSTAAMIIADTNLQAASLQWLAACCNQKNIPLLLEPVSVSKAKKLAEIDLKGVFMLTPNEVELPSLSKHTHRDTGSAIHELLERGVKKIWLRKGAKGSEMYSKQNTLSLPGTVIAIKDSTGAGDAALAGWAAAWYMGMDEWQCLKAGHAMALEVLQVTGAFATNMTKEKLLNAVKKYYPDEP
ncbi:MAG: PfkB family carbohydrate kinase [Ferruginibacter sp.]